MGFFKKVVRETRRVVGQANNVVQNIPVVGPVIAPVVVPVVAAAIPVVGPVLAVATVVEDPQKFAETAVQIFVPEMAPVMSIVQNPQNAVPIVLGGIAPPEVKLAVEVMKNPQTVVPVLLANSVITPEAKLIGEVVQCPEQALKAGMSTVRMHIIGTHGLSGCADDEQKNSFIEKMVPEKQPQLPNPVCTEKKNGTTGAKYFNVNDTTKKTDVCKWAQDRANAVCEEVGDTDLDEFAGGDFVVAQGMICTAACKAAKQACE